MRRGISQPWEDQLARTGIKAEDGGGSARDNASFGAGLSGVVKGTSKNYLDEGTESASASIRPVERLRLQYGLSDGQIMGQLRKVQWFKSLPHSDLAVLYARGRHKFFPRYATIMREGTEGNTFFILLHGVVNVHSSRHGTMRLQSGGSFGEGALVTTRVQREASATAEADCYVLLLTAADVAGLNLVELFAEVRPQVTLQLLRCVHGKCFQSLHKAQQLALAQLVEVREYLCGEVVFAEGDEPSQQTAVFVMVEGHVHLHKRDAISGGQTTIGEHLSTDEYPWFGEGALSSYRPRPCSAVCREATKCLVVRAPAFEEFLELLPAILRDANRTGAAAG